MMTSWSLGPFWVLCAIMTIRRLPAWSTPSSLVGTFLIVGVALHRLNTLLAVRRPRDHSTSRPFSQFWHLVAPKCQLFYPSPDGRLTTPLGAQRRHIFCTPYQTLFPHIPRKFCLVVILGYVPRSRQVTIPGFAMLEWLEFVIDQYKTFSVS